MTNIRIAFEKIDGGTPNDMRKVKIRPGHEHINLHMIFDILREVSCLSQNLCSPREGHLDEFYSIFRYLQKKLGNNPGRMAYDPMYEPKDKNIFEVVGRDLDQWKDFFPDA